MSEIHSSCDCFLRILERQGCRELAAAQLFSKGVALAPTLDEKQMFARHCLDELGHFEQVAARYEGEGGGDLLAKVRHEVDALPVPETWLEMVLVGIAFDRAVYYQLRAYAAAPDRRVAELAVQVIADEHEHLAASQAALSDLAQKRDDLAADLSRLVERWLPISRDCFDSGPIGSAECPNGPHVSVEATATARKAYFESLEAVLGPRGIAVQRYAAGS
jgi:1,2-phenylacetyl-CoA epoxidase catalytic subunit